MNEDSYLILDYLPFSYKTGSENEYINFLWDCFESNYTNEKYQFAFIAYHMLFMSFVYFEIWQIRINLKNDFEKALIGFGKEVEKDMINAESPFSFCGSKIKERTIFRFLKLLGCDNSKIGNFTKIVDERNNVAHSNGNIFFKDHESIDDKIAEILKCVEEIQNFSKPLILDCFKIFLIENWDAGNREYMDDNDQIREILIHNNYFSKKDIEICLNFKINSLSEQKHFKEIKRLFKVFKNEYKE